MRDRIHRRRRGGFRCRLAFLTLLLPIDAGATTILYSLEDLADDGSGDRVRYTYFVSGRSFDSGDRFSILFDPTLFTRIETPEPAVGADWDTLVLQPDGGLPSAGRYEGIATADGASLADGFQIVTILSGGASPGDQPFEIFDSGFQLLASGTTAPIPEPRTAALFAFGLSGLAGLRRRARGRAAPATGSS